MRFESVTSYNFGPFLDQTISFNPSMNVVWGPMRLGSQPGILLCMPGYAVFGGGAVSRDARTGNSRLDIDRGIRTTCGTLVLSYALKMVDAFISSMT